MVFEMRLPGMAASNHELADIAWDLTIPLSSATQEVLLTYSCTSNSDSYYGIPDADVESHISTVISSDLPGKTNTFSTDASELDFEVDSYGFTLESTGVDYTNGDSTYYIFTFPVKTGMTRTVSTADELC